MEKCKHCGSENTKPLKSWTMKNPKGNTETKVTFHLCLECGKKFRHGERLLTKEED